MVWALVCSVLAPPVLAQATSVHDLVYPPLPQVEIPRPERMVLDNGMVVLLLEDHELPLIEARALIRTGARWEPEDKTGLAALTGQVLRSGGTESLASDELDDLLEDRATILETAIDASSGTAFMSCLRDDFPEMLNVFADVLRRPSFEEDKLAVATTQAETGVARQNDNAHQILEREFRELIYGADSPQARNPTYDTLRNVRRHDLVTWHARYYHPDRIVLGLVGDFDSKEALALVERTFGDWPRGPEVPAPAVDVDDPDPGIYFIEKGDVNQSYVRMGHLGLRRDHPDYYAVEVMNRVLGLSSASRLYYRIRSRKALAYDVSGQVGSQWDYRGIFQMSMSTKTETTAAGIDALLEEADNMTSEPPTDEEVDRGKNILLSSFVFRAASSHEVLRQQLTYEYYGYPLDWLDRYRRGIDGVTTAQVRAAAAGHIRPDRLVILVVGPGQARDQLNDLGDVRVVDVTIPEAQPLPPTLWETYGGLATFVGAALLAGGLLAGAWVAWRSRKRQHKVEAQHSLDFARKTEELESARQVQLSMLPKEDLASECFEIAGQMQTATEVGGDYYDYFHLPDGRLFIAIGDATGHGVSAGLMVGMVKASLEGAASDLARGVPLVKLMRQLNAILKRSISERGLGMALGIGIVDFSDLTLELCMAGMPYPYHFDGTGAGRLTRLEMNGTPLGLMKRIRPQSRKVRLQEKDVVVFLSDGLYERLDSTDQIWGFEALEETLLHLCRVERNPRRIGERLIAACDAFAGGRVNDDDMTVLALRVRAGG